MRFRICSVPGCDNKIFACMGTTKAGDVLEFVEGNRDIWDVRELCEKCATKTMFVLELLPLMQFFWLQTIGWAPKLLSAPVA